MAVEATRTDAPVWLSPSPSPSLSASPSPTIHISINQSIKQCKMVGNLYYFNSDINRLHNIAILKYALQTTKSGNVQYSTKYIKSIIYDANSGIMKHDKIQYMLMRLKRRCGGVDGCGSQSGSNSAISINQSINL